MEPRELSLSVLYKHDPFYARCLSHLMTAPPPVTKQFLQEQRCLTQSLKRLDRHLQIRLGEIHEEKKRFAVMMSRRLGSSKFPSLVPNKTGFQTFATQSVVTISKNSPARLKIPAESTWNRSGDIKSLQMTDIYFTLTSPKDKTLFGQTVQHLARGERASSALRSESISKILLRASYRPK